MFPKMDGFHPLGLTDQKAWGFWGESSCSRNQNNFVLFVNIVFSQIFTINAKTYMDMLFLNF